MTSIDVVIRNTANEDFELVDAQTLEHLAGPFGSFAAAIVAAQNFTVGGIFHQMLDHRGRALGDPRLIRPQST